MAAIRYGQPLVEAITPWLRRGIIDRTDAESDWPPTMDEARLARYADFEALIENRPQDVFESLELERGQRSKIALALALPELLCNVWADAVWSDPPSLEWKEDSLRDTWDAVWNANGSDDLGWTSAFSAAFRGSSVLKLRRDEELADLTGHEIQIEEIHPGIFFPVLRSGSDRLIEYVVIAYEELREGRGDKAESWQLRERHYIDGTGKYAIAYEERRKGQRGGFKQRKPEEQTNIDFLPFVDLHSVRWSGRYWGVSELSRNMTLFDEVDNRWSEIAEVLEYHGKPMLQVPSSVMRGNVLEKGADRAIGIRNAADADVARYITWDGMIDSQIMALDKLVEHVLLTSEVAPTYFGFAEGTSLSGTALKLRLQNFVKKANRKQRIETIRLQRLAKMVHRMAGVADAPLANVVHGEPLPVDDKERSEIESALTGNKPLSSRLSAIKRLRNVEDAQAELDAIEDEEAADVTNTASSRGTPLPAPAGLAATGAAVTPPPAAAGAREPAE